MMGQDAVNTAQAFNEQLNFDGVVLTKLDGDSRGGAALSIRRVVDKPIKFISSGEKLETLERFYPDRMASRILGMGDIVSLVEKAQATYDGEQASILQRKFRKNQFTLSDFLSQLDQIKKMGNIKDLLSMVPGANKAIKNMDITADTFKPTEAIIRSMTTSEKENPEILNPSRKSRIAAGSGTSIQQINQLLRQFDQMKQMMKSMNKSPRR